MTEAILLVRRLRLEGVSIYTDTEGLLHIMPAGFLTPEDRELIRQNKPAVVAWLKWYAEDIGCDEAARRWQSEARRQSGSKT